jgi:catechol 2,3-dioxygenase-like lactoylglutathione lyase family enzyme
MTAPSLHHLALVCKDVEATHHFYHDLLGFELIHTESQKMRGGYIRHFFYDLGDGSCIAFFDLHGVGEPDDFDTAISTGLGLPAWVNHVALRSDTAKSAEIVARCEAEGIKPDMVLDHGWCKSTYFKDPNGNLVEFTVDDPGFTPNPEEAKRMLLGSNSD